MEYIEHAVEEAYLACDRAYKSLERFKAHRTTTDDPTPLAFLATEATQGLLAHREMAEWVAFAQAILKKAKLEAERGD